MPGGVPGGAGVPGGGEHAYYSTRCVRVRASGGGGACLPRNVEVAKGWVLCVVLWLGGSRHASKCACLRSWREGTVGLRVGGGAQERGPVYGVYSMSGRSL